MKELTTLLKIGNELPVQPGDFDLRFFRRDYFSDAYDGRSPVSDGCQRSIILYGGNVVWMRSKVYVNGTGFGSTETGDEMFWHLYLVSELWLQILRIGRAKFFEGHLFEQDKELRASSQDWDIILPTEPKILDILTAHPQYRSLVEDFGLSLEKVRRGHLDYLQVNVSKHFERQAIGTSSEV